MDKTLSTELRADFDLSTAKWVRFGGSPRFDYRIDYAVSVVEADVETGRIDFLARWEPNAYCHYHRHLGATEAAVVAGEQHLTDVREFETVKKIRTVGFKGHTPDGETHMECAGPEGLTMFFSTHVPDGCLYEVLDPSGKVLAAPTIAEFLDLMRSEAA